MKKLFVTVIIFAFARAGAQSVISNPQNGLFTTASWERINGNENDSLGINDLLKAINVYQGIPADSILRSGSNTFLFFGNFKVTLKTKRDYQFYREQLHKCREKKFEIQKFYRKLYPQCFTKSPPRVIFCGILTIY